MGSDNNKRQLKVYASKNQYADKKQAPCIRIEGKWLSDIGFNIGDYITVECCNGELIIRKDDARKQLEQDTIQKYKDQINKLSVEELSYLKKALDLSDQNKRLFT